jgi:cytochrome c biogenesis protein CcmG/thiol:disulfide interchange protein DsbE
MAEGLFMSRTLRFVPIILLGLIVAGLVWRLAVPADRNVESKLAGKPVPAFDAPAVLPAKAGLSASDLRGGPRLVNFFASWCVPCIAEAKTLAALKERGVQIDGIAVRDRGPDVARFLVQNGDPYARIGGDEQSQIQIAFGSSGVPESFVVDGRGIIRYQHIGPIEPEDVPTLLAKLAEART